MPDRDQELAGLRAELARARRQIEKKNERIAELRGRLARTLPSPGGDVPVFFLVGHGRSGTTWLMRLLDSHPEVLCAGEGWPFNRGFRRDDLKDLHPRLKVSSLYNAIAENDHLRMWVERSVWGRDPDEDLDNLTRLAIEYFFGRRLALMNARKGTHKRMVGDKTPFASTRILDDVFGERGGPHSSGVEVLEEISRVCPGAKVIHAIRDGRDVAVSVMHFMRKRARGQEGGIYDLAPEERRGGFTERRLATIASVWREQVGEAVELGPSALGDDYLEVRYEDLLSRPEDALGGVLSFLGADPSEARTCLEAVAPEGADTVRFRKGIAGDWKNVFTERDKEIFKEEAGDLLVRLGYEKDKDW